jgi:hypothetical protein
MKAYAYVNLITGTIEVQTAPSEEKLNVLLIEHNSVRRLREAIERWCRLGYSGEQLLPGMPEANTAAEAASALVKFGITIHDCLKAMAERGYK